MNRHTPFDSCLALRCVSYFFALLVAIIHINASAAPAPNGIVAWWPLQGNGNDVSGRNHPLTIQGNPIFGDGEVGQAMVLDGGNDYGRVAAHPDLDLGANDGLTIELWISPANTSPQQPLLEWTDSNSVVGLHFWMSVVSPWAGGGPRSLFANVIDRNGVAHHVSSAPGVIASNAFTHVAFTYSKVSGLAKLYANGQAVATTNIGSLTPETRTALYAGWRPVGSEQYRFAGKLDEITLYSRELSQPELNSIFQAGAQGKAPVTNPPPVATSDFNLARDFSVLGNPNGVWSYGYVPFIAGPFTLMNTPRTDEQPAIPIWSWSVNGFSSPDVHFNASSSNVFYGDGGTFPPKTLWSSPGHETSSNAFSVMRFTAPSNGTYRVRATARSYLDAASGDSDYHVVKNGTELFGVFLPAGAQSTGFSNTLSLSLGDTLDFVVGRGQDGLLYASGLKLEAVITPTTNAPTATNPPPPVVAGNFDVSRDFAMSSNPTGVWSYGWKSNFAGSLGLLADVRTFSADNGVPIRAWELTTYNLPVVAKVLGPNTAVSDGGRFTAPAGTVYFAPGADGTPQNYGVIRFTAPTGGNYRVEASVNPLFDSTRSRDSDFHILRNGLELFGAFLQPNTGTNYAAMVALAAGQALDFAVGRGADGLTADTGLKIAALVTLTTNAPSGTNPPPVTPTLISLWHADGDAEDAIGTNDGVLVNNVGFAPGVSGQAFRLDGSNYMRVADSASLDLANQLSVELWFKRSADLPFGTAFTLVDKRTTVACNYGANMSQNYGLTLYYNETGQNFRILTTALPSADEWHHFVGTYRQVSNTVRLVIYLDGVGVATNTFSGSLAGAVNDGNLSIGSARDGVSDYFRGLIDEVAIYNYALSPSQVHSNYNRVVPPGTNDPSNFVFNGSFELGTDPGSSGQIDAPNSSDIASWVVESGNIDYVGSRWVAGDGQRCIDLSGASAGVIAQTISGLVVGQTYRLSFLMAANPEAPPPSTDLLVTVGNASNRFSVTVAGTVGDLRWTQQTMNFTAAGGTVLRFVSLNPGWAGPVLDHVAITAVSNVPPPSGLVFNGSFELGTDPGSSTQIDAPNSSDIAGWTVESGNIDYVGSRWTAGDGNRCIDLTGTTQGTISQNISGFTPGQTYRLSFLMAGNPELIPPFPAVKELRAIIGSTSHEFSFDASVRSGANMGWSLQSFQFTAESSTLELSFTSLTDGLGGPALDGVSIVPTETNTNPPPVGPTIITQPQSQTVVAGAPVTFTVIATGAPPLHYRWTRNGLSLPNAGGPSLTLSNVQPAQAGVYRAIVTNFFGSTASTSAVLAVIAGTNPPPVAPALISLWHADGNAEDAVGTNDGLLVNNVGFVPGVSGQAFRLGGTNFIRVPDSASLDLSNGLTMQMWFKRDENLPLNTSFTLIDKRTDSVANYGANMSQNFGLQLYYNAGNGFALSASPLPSAGAWHHFAGTYRQRSNGVELITYLDGSAVRTNTLPGTLAAAVNDAPLAIGATRDGATDYFKGLIDEVGLYNYALSAAQVHSNYISITPPGTNVPPIIAGDFDAGRDFSAANNPAGVWSYGWKGNLGGNYSNLTVKHSAILNNGVSVPAWFFASGVAPGVYCNTSGVTGIFEGGAAHVEPKTIWYYPGPNSYGVVRFTAPSNGNYQVATAARPVYNGPPQGDTDFHVLRNGTELFGQFLAAGQSAGFTGILALAANDVVDFAIGRGADNNDYGSALKLSAVITPTSQPLGTNASAGFSITSPKVAGNGFEFTFTPGGNSASVIEVSEDLVHWNILTNIVCTNSSMPFFDPGALNLPRRFYRARPGTP